MRRTAESVQSVFYWLIHLGDGLIRLESLYRYLRKYHPRSMDVATPSCRCGICYPGSWSC